MTSFFDAYKKYITRHPKVIQYKPTSDKFNATMLYNVKNKVDNTICCTENDEVLIGNFVKFSNDLYVLYIEFYKQISNDFKKLNIKGKEIAEYIIAGLNREYKVIWNKHNEKYKDIKQGSYLLSDIMNFKLQSISPEVGLIDVRAALESMTDATSLLLNYLRYFLENDFVSENADSLQFSVNIMTIMQKSQLLTVLKHSYDDILYNNGFIEIDEEKRNIIFNYENHNNLKLILAGDMMYDQRRLQVFSKINENDLTPRLYKYISKYRIKKVKINDGSIKLDFGKGNAKEFKNIISDIQSSIDSYYEFLPYDIKLPNFSGSVFEEVIAVWCAIQYIVSYVFNNVDFDTTIYTSKDFSIIPRKILKNDLLMYIEKLTGLRYSKIKVIVSSLEANWCCYNDIWSSMLYPINDYYLLPFFTIINTTTYNIVDKLLQRGGFSLEVRGKWFEDFLYNELTYKTTSFPIKCLPAKKYCIKGKEEEIDLLISMKNTILIADAKCIHYSVEPHNYAEARERLEDGCKQVLRKMEFVKNNCDLFGDLGDVATKTIIPFVITNYPTFSGFSYNGVYIIDSHSFLAYMHSGIMTCRSIDLTSNTIVSMKRFYNNEDEFSDAFISYLSDNPMKKELLKRIYIHNLPMPRIFKSWSIYSKSAQVKNNPIFNISNNGYCGQTVE